VETVKGLINGVVKPIRQESLPSTIDNEQIAQNSQYLKVNELKHAPKLFTDTCQIDWNTSVYNIYNLIRGLSPYPAAFTFINDKKLKVFKATKEIMNHNEETGKVFTDQKSFIKLSCIDGFISITELQLEGKKRMGVVEFLRGFRF
jgi:methionyl-tRNA formyltransferase